MERQRWFNRRNETPLLLQLPLHPRGRLSARPLSAALDRLCQLRRRRRTLPPEGDSPAALAGRQIPPTSRRASFWSRRPSARAPAGAPCLLIARIRLCFFRRQHGAVSIGQCRDSRQTDRPHVHIAGGSRYSPADCRVRAIASASSMGSSESIHRRSVCASGGTGSAGRPS